jgi:hypothetical protein
MISLAKGSSRIINTQLSLFQFTCIHELIFFKDSYYFIIIIIIIIIIMSRYSDWLGAGWLRDQSSIPGRGKIFLPSIRFRPILGPTQPPIQWVSETLSPRVKRPGREADHSPPTSAKIKNTWIYTSTYSPIRLHGVVLN